MYYCKHCGEAYMTDEAVMCVRCQAPKGKGTNFCPFCGARAEQNQKICMECGIDMDNYGVVGVKSKIGAGLLAIFLGSFGVHNFYLVYTKKAIIQLILGLSVVFVYVSVIWGIYEGILLFTDKLNVDGKGKIIL